MLQKTKDLIAILFLTVSVVSFTASSTNLWMTMHKVVWSQHPMVSDNDPYTPTTGWMKDVIIGLRADGVVVWRAEKKK